MTTTLIDTILKNEKATIIKIIDDRVALIYQKYQRFSIEYQLREKQAKAFKANNYQGDVPSQITAYQIPAGLTAQQACDDILAQAARLTNLLETLATLRMKKQLIKHCKTIEQLTIVSNKLLTQINYIESIA